MKTQHYPAYTPSNYISYPHEGALRKIVIFRANVNAHAKIKSNWYNYSGHRYVTALQSHVSRKHVDTISCGSLFIACFSSRRREVVATSRTTRRTRMAGNTSSADSLMHDTSTDRFDEPDPLTRNGYEHKRAAFTLSGW